MWQRSCKKNMRQWFFKITDYADELLSGLDKIDWPEKTKILQRNWIGKSIGAEVDFKIEGSDEKLTVFTSRADTLFGVTFLVIAPEHKLVSKLIKDEYKESVEKYIQDSAKRMKSQEPAQLHLKLVHLLELMLSIL